MPSEDEAEIVGLVARLQGGDQSALAELFDRHRDKLRRMVELRLDARLAGRVSASDVLQEAYIDAVKRVEHYFSKDGQSFFGWLRLVVGQRIADVHREHLAGKRDAGRDIGMNRGATTDSTCLAARLLGPGSSPSQAAQRQEVFAQLESALEQMDPLDREVLALRHFEELSNTDTAEALRIQPAAASKRYVRALARLKEILEGIPGFAP